MNTLPSTTGWLDEFADCVRRRDPQRGRSLFAPDIRAFGTRAEQVNDLAELVEHQWSKVWFNTRGFRFFPKSVQELTAADDSLVCVLALWDSEGLDGSGRSFTRRGRCTIALRREKSSPLGYVAIHTHFSKTPPDEL